MAKYAYAPLSIDDQRNRNRGGGGGGGLGSYFGSPNDGPNHRSNDNNNNNDGEDHLVQERMPLCVGFCVLLAIVFVLTRTGDSEAIYNSHSAMRPANASKSSSTTSNNNNNVILGGQQQQQAGKAFIPEAETATTASGTTVGGASSATSSGSTYGSTIGGGSAGGATIGGSTINAATTIGGTTTPDGCPEPPTCPPSTLNIDNPQDANNIMATLRAKALEGTKPHIIECAKAEAGESQSACHLPPAKRYAALGQKGATLWMTGCSGAGKTTIATALEEKLIMQYGKHVYRLDGDNLRTGINRDLSFTEADRAESVRRTGELATLFSDAGIITLVGLISPYRGDRDKVRQRHEEQGIPFYEIFLDVPIDELMSRDPKGQYAKVASGELKHFTCIDDPYEPPIRPEITLKTHELQIEDSVNILFRQLEKDGILQGAPKVIPDSNLPNPDGDELVDLHVPEQLREERKREAATLPKVLLQDIDLNWLQTIGEGWAAPLKGFMREGALLEALHFNSMLTDPFNLTGNIDRLQTKTDFNHFPEHPPPQRVSMSIPITLSCTSFTKDLIESSDQSAIALVTQMGQTVAILRDPEVYTNRKEEIVTRMYGVIDMDHPYIKHIYSGGDYLIGGEIELLDRIRYNDGLDEWRKTVTELTEEFKAKGADTVYAFQTRNPTHAGHAYLMRSAGENLKRQGYEKPVLWLSPLGGWTKEDDVPLDVRVKQHEFVLEAGTSHPGGLDPATTVMAIWPAPMVYAGPTEVQFHAKSRRNAGASYFVVGRDPAGMKGSPNAVAHPDDDLYDGDHGRYVLQNAPGIAGQMNMLSFVKVMYDTSDNVMKVPDESRMDDFISISGSKMRLLARNGASLCSPTNIPTDLVEANCIPSGFMVPKGWEQVCDYYKHQEETERWIPWSQPFVEPPVAKNTEMQGKFGKTSFEIRSQKYESWWHDIPYKPANPVEPNIIHFITEIPMHMAAKMEVQKKLPGNPIAQDKNKDGSPRYYTYGTPFFNYGFVPQTWEDPNLKSAQGYGGDNDPVDIMEFGSIPLRIGSLRRCRVLGSLELIDEGETDHKILCIALHETDDPEAQEAADIRSLEQLEAWKPGTLDRLRDWLKRYKTSDGKPENNLASEIPRTIDEAMAVVEETHKHWQSLCGLDGTSSSSLSSKTDGFWLDSPECRGGGGL